MWGNEQHAKNVLPDGFSDVLHSCQKLMIVALGQFSRKAQGTDHLLCSFWRAGFKARPPYTQLASCYTIFQLSNRTIMCILDKSGGGWEVFF